MRSLEGLYVALLQDCGRQCSAPVERSIKTLRTRVEHEGDGFLTIVLPAFCRDFERSLDAGRVVPGSFAHFRKRRAGIPAFLSEFLYQVFDKDGILVAAPSTHCIRAIRQICLFGKKILRECCEARTKSAFEGYATCDCEVIRELPDTQLGRYFKVVATSLMTSLNLEEVAMSDLRPKHGPGATREGITGNGKYSHRIWHDRLEAVGFTYAKFGRSSEHPFEAWELSNWPVRIEPDAEAPVRVTAVPKTQTTPRLIAVEPVCMQYAQQALSAVLVGQLSRDRFTKGHVNFVDQTVNQDLAVQGSRDGFYATLDMKDASDRVSLAHVRSAFATSPKWLSWMEACRSVRAELPSGEVIQLDKFASMGSALCFPVESLIFFISIIASRISKAGHFPTPSRIYEYSRQVYVYGDDLIVPSDEAQSICEDLEALGFRVNRQKSFWSGYFRESCGVDSYAGIRVTPVYLRRDLPTDRGDIPGLLSTVATANQLERAGYSVVAQRLRDSVECLVGKLPMVGQDSAALGWTDGHSEAVPRQRWNRSLQRREIFALVPVTPDVPDVLEDYGALVKGLSYVGNTDVAEGHLLESPSPYGLALRRRWVSATSRLR